MKSSLVRDSSKAVSAMKMTIALHYHIAKTHFYGALLHAPKKSLQPIQFPLPIQLVHLEHHNTVTGTCVYLTIRFMHGSIAFFF
jgi:hypothetical protein